MDPLNSPVDLFDCTSTAASPPLFRYFEKSPVSEFAKVASDGGQFRPFELPRELFRAHRAQEELGQNAITPRICKRLRQAGAQAHWRGVDLLLMFHMPSVLSKP